MWLWMLLILVTHVASTQAPSSRRAQRLPFQKKHIEFKAPTTYAKRIWRYDAKTGEPVYYDPRPQVVLLDKKSGRYAFKWIGYDGEEKAVIFQRADAIDAVISASVSKKASGLYVYIYTIQNLTSSGEHLSGFAIQTWSPTVKPEPIGDGYVGQMSRNKEMKEGNWIYFGSSNFKGTVIPGRSIALRLVSPSPPGLVECRIHGGELGLKGVGEDMPQELENVLPGYNDWPSGFTIGPVDNLKTFSQTERANYLLRLLPKLKELGWITEDALAWYGQDLKRNDFAIVQRRAEEDLRQGSITTEVFAMIQAITQ